MGWFRRDEDVATEPASAVTDTVELPLGAGVGVPGEGGPHLLADSLAEYRWLAQQEAVTLANADLDPLAWPDGQMGFAFERYLAHGHEALRDRVANAVSARLRDEVRALYGTAASIASVRDGLATADTALAEVDGQRRKVASTVTTDPLELARYHRHRSGRSRSRKATIVLVLVLMELIVSGRLFEAALRLDFPGLGFLFAGGLTLLLIVIPHYAAAALKEVSVANRSGARGHGLTWGAGGLLLLLAGLLVPLSRLRADHAGEGDAVWFWFYLTVQAGISGYFFLRELLDHSTDADTLLELDLELEAVRDHRDGLFDRLADLVAEFHESAEEVVFTIREAPHWDDHVVEAYHETVEGFRHTLVAQRGELAPFLYWARTPTLGGRAGRAPHASMPAEPIGDVNGRLDESSPLGRDFWMDALADAIEDLTTPGGASVEAAADHTWLLSSLPQALLEGFLQRFFGMDPTYLPPGAARSDAAPSPATSVQHPENGHSDRPISIGRQR